MDAAVAIETILERGVEFVRDPEVRLLHLVVGAELRDAALDVVMSLELRPSNRAPFVSFEQAHTLARPGWAERSEHARRQHEARGESMAAEGESLPPLPAAPAGEPSLAFATQLWQLQQARPPDTSGLVVVFAPEQVENTSAWSEHLRRLFASKELAQARYVVIDVERDTIGPFDDRCIKEQCDLDPSGADKLLSALAAGERAGAGPKGVTPPPRPGRQDEVPTAEATAQKALTMSIAGAALASGRGDHGEAVRQARAATQRAGEELRPTLELMLGGYLLQAGQLKAAEHTFDEARATAERDERATDLASARFALASTSLLRRDGHGALVHYAEASIAAEHAGDPTLAIEGCRVTGQLACDLGMEPQAITFLSKAVKLAEAAPALGPLTSAGDAARRLARLCRKRGVVGSAQELDAKAERFDRVEAPEPQPEPPRPSVPPTPAVAPEGTEEIPVADLAAMHWAGIPPTPTEADPIDPVAPAGSIVLRRFTADELQRLHYAVGEAMVEETTAMLSEAELLAMRQGPPQILLGEQPSVAQQPRSDPSAPDPFSHLDEAALAEMRARVAEAEDEDDASMLNLDRVKRLRDEILREDDD